MQMHYIKHSKARTVVRNRTKLVSVFIIIRSSASELVDEFDLLYAWTGRAWAHPT